MSKQLFRDGQYVRDLGDDESYIVQDRESIRFNVQFMDAMPVFDTVGHRPGSVSLTDSERERRADMHDAQKARISDQRRNPSPLAPDVARTPIKTGDATEDAYSRRNAVLENAWAAR